MSERPILFSSSMIRAILDGRKHQTRRVVKLRPPYVMDERDEGRPCPWPWSTTWAAGDEDDGWMPCPYGLPGRDRLWVRETWAPADPRYSPLAPVVYRADGDDQPCLDARWRPSIYMPRWASRITLEVTGVRVERLQDISDEDAIGEGISCGDDAWHAGPDGRYMRDRHGWYVGHTRHNAPSHAFREAWDQINGQRAPWASDPWVWVIDFRRQA
jgi:hypothetical protein